MEQHDHSNRVEKAEAKDEPIVKSMTDTAYSKYIDRLGKKPAPMNADHGKDIAVGNIYILWDDSGEAVGIISLFKKSDSIQIESIVVKPSSQGHGYGRMLMQFAEDYARMHDISSLELYTNEAMYENVLLYPKLGYIETGRHRQDGFNRVFFRKTL